MQPHPNSKDCNVMGYWIWTTQRMMSSNYDTLMELFDRAMEGKMDGRDWATMVALGFAKSNPFEEKFRPLTALAALVPFVTTIKCQPCRNVGPQAAACQCVKRKEDIGERLHVRFHFDNIVMRGGQQRVIMEVSIPKLTIGPILRLSDIIIVDQPGGNIMQYPKVCTIESSLKSRLLHAYYHRDPALLIFNKPAKANAQPGLHCLPLRQ